MKNLLLLTVTLFVSTLLMAQSPIGKWDSYDDETGELKSKVEIFKKKGKLFGKIEKVYGEAKANNSCTKCKGDKNGLPLVGLEIIENLSKDGNEWEDGTIVDPKNGKVYDCKIWLEGNDTLKVRGYVAFFYRTQTWKRVK